jgi:hypothetical protein
VRCSGAVLLRVGRNGARYCTYRSTLLPAGPAWSTAWGVRAADQRGLAVRRRDWQAAGEAPRESLDLPRKISTTTVGISFRGRLKSDLIIAKSHFDAVKVPYKSIVNNSDTFGCISAFTRGQSVNRAVAGSAESILRSRSARRPLKQSRRPQTPPASTPTPGPADAGK